MAISALGNTQIFPSFAQKQEIKPVESQENSAGIVSRFGTEKQSALSSKAPSSTENFKETPKETPKLVNNVSVLTVTTQTIAESSNVTDSSEPLNIVPVVSKPAPDEGQTDSFQSNVAGRIQSLLSDFFNNTGVFGAKNSPSNVVERVQFLLSNISQIIEGKPLLAYSPPDASAVSISAISQPATVAASSVDAPATIQFSSSQDQPKTDNTVIKNIPVTTFDAPTKAANAEATSFGFVSSLQTNAGFSKASYELELLKNGELFA